MPSEALQHSARQPVRAAISTTPPRLRPKGPLGPDFPRQLQVAAAGRPKQSAVERLEADKAKYVKSQVALSKQLPVKAPNGPKPPAPQSTALRPTRRSPVPLKARREQVELNLLNNLTNLISDVNDGPQQPSAAAGSQDEAPAVEQQQQKKEKPRPPPPPPRPDWSSPAKVRLKASGPARENPSPSPLSPTARTVRRVDVMPLAGTPRRAPVTIRQPLHPVWLQQPHFPLRQAASRFHLQHPSKTAGAPRLKPVAAAPQKPAVPAGAEPPTAALPTAPLPPPLPLFPPPSPAGTRRSSCSSRKRPSLTRSKSDMSDRCSRAGTELERFFNLCGLDPADLQEWAGSCSDIVSMARFRSVSAPGSECAASDREEAQEEEDEEEEGNPAARVPYGLSVIERNARVIKWLYGLRNAKDGTNKSTDL